MRIESFRPVELSADLSSSGLTAIMRILVANRLARASLRSGASCPAWPGHETDGSHPSARSTEAELFAPTDSTCDRRIGLKAADTDSCNCTLCQYHRIRLHTCRAEDRIARLTSRHVNAHLHTCWGWMGSCNLSRAAGDRRRADRRACAGGLLGEFSPPVLLAAMRVGSRMCSSF